MKNVVIMVDGTWNDDGKDRQERSELTNVFWLDELCEKSVQTVEYEAGVGTGGWLDKATGGALGLGLTKGICKAYQQACEAYEPGDKLFFFGFSRGAYTVRTAVGMIAKLGLADLKAVDKKDRKSLCKDLFLVYRAEKELSEVPGITFFNADDPEQAGGTTPVHMVGVWDTVGTAGIPDHYRVLNRIDWFSDRHNWANTQLSDIVQHGRHAIAMDERRESFVPAFWTNEDDTVVNNNRIKQLWFSGVHSDVGGGYDHRDLGNITMAWMVDEAVKLGLTLVENPDRPVPKERAMGPVNDSLTSVFKRMRSRPRGVPDVHDPANEELFHPSVLRRYGNPESPSIPTWRSTSLKVGDSVERVVWAKDRWTMLEIYVEPDKTYEIAAKGTWFDKGREFDPNGTWLNKPSTRVAGLFDVHKVPNWISRFATMGRKATDNRILVGAWRSPHHGAFKLMGVIADTKGVKQMDDGAIMPARHTEFEIGHGTTIGPGKKVEVTKSGYLYCFPNDLWSKYANNSGSITVTITRR